MTYIVPGVQALIDEVTELRPKAKVTPSDEVDGFDRVRSLNVDANTAKWLAPILEAVEDDRIAEVSEDGKTITFVADSRADHAHAFGLADADGVLVTDTTE